MEDFFFIFFRVKKIILGTPKSGATSLWGVLFSSSLRVLYLVSKDLSERCCFPAGLVTMSDVWCVFLLNENKQGWRNKNIPFAVRCLIWHSIWLQPYMHDFSQGNSSDTALLFKLRTWNTPKGWKHFSKYGGFWTMEVRIMESHLWELVKKFSLYQRNRSNNRRLNHGKLNNRGSTVLLNLRPQNKFIFVFQGFLGFCKF